jgi:hypothetical protein
MSTDPKTTSETADATLAKIELVDWRIQDGDDRELTEGQKQSWTMSVKEGGWGAVIEFTAPDGTVRSMNVELSQGNPRLFIYSDGDEAEACVTLGRDKVHVRADNAPGGAYPFQGATFGKDGMVAATDDAEPDFVDVAPTP